MASEITEKKIVESGKHSREAEEENKETCEPPLKKQSVGSSVSDENPGDASHGTNEESESESNKSPHPESPITDSMIQRMSDTYGVVYIGGGFFEPGPDYQQKIRAFLESEYGFCEELCDWRKCYGLARNQDVYCIWLTDRSWDDSECKLILKENGCSESCFLRRSMPCGSMFYAALDDKQAAKLRDVNEVVRMAPAAEMACVE